MRPITYKYKEPKYSTPNVSIKYWWMKKQCYNAKQIGIIHNFYPNLISLNGYCKCNYRLRGKWNKIPFFSVVKVGTLLFDKKTNSHVSLCRSVTSGIVYGRLGRIY